MNFTQIPPRYAPLGGELRYAVEDTVADDIDIYISGPGSTPLYGTLRFAASQAASFDIAPFLRSRLGFEPVVRGTGFHAATGRTVAAMVVAGRPGTLPDGAQATTSAQPFLAGCRTVEAPALCTTFPLQRLIPEGSSDELTILAPDSGTVKATVTARRADTAAARNYTFESGGPVLFVLDTRDFSGAEQLTVAIEGIATVEYTVVPAAQQLVRVAWRSSAGSVEQYGFPVERTRSLQVEKLRATSPEGHVAVTRGCEVRRTLVSAYETEGLLAALSEVLAAPEVWIVGEEACTPVDVLTDTATLRRLGSLCNLEIEIRERANTPKPWN